MKEQPDPIPPSLKDALHIAPGSFAGTLMQAGARRGRVFPLMDDLTWGPCATKPARHDAIRRAHWKGVYQSGHPWQTNLLDWLDEIPRRSSALLRQRVEASEYPIVVWTSRTEREYLPALWALSLLRAARVDLACVWLAQPVRRGANWSSLAWHPAEETPKLLARARVAGDLVAQSERTWRAWCAASPRGLVRQATQLRPPIDLRSYARLLPTVREDEGRVLRLSYADSVLLRGFSTEKWMQPRELLRDRHQPLMRLISTHGDLFVLVRWRAWSIRPLGPALEARRELFGGQGPWGDVAYRLTSFGESLLRQGMNGPEEMPPVMVGGHNCSSPSHIWVRATRGRGWRLAPWSKERGLEPPLANP